MKKTGFILVMVLLLSGYTTRVHGESSVGFSGGIMVHAGYLFSDDPTKVFSNTGLGSAEYVKGLPKAGACYGIGGTLRLHLIDHIHVGAEGFLSGLPLRGVTKGSNVRTGWAGAFCDYYTTWGSRVQPIAGLSVGGGTMKRLFVTEAVTSGASESQTNYNASYVNTPFFYMDPYVGLEINLNEFIALLIRIDYMLPFGRTKSDLASLESDVKWSNFMTPSGPRLHVGVLLGKLRNE